MPYRIRPGLSYCLCEGRPIFLDIDSGRYSTLPEALCAPFSALLSGEDEIAVTAIERLQALGVIKKGVPTPAAIELLPAPTHQLAATRGELWPITAGIAQTVAAYHVRHVPLRKLLETEAGRRASNRSAADWDLGRLRGDFDRIASLVGEADACFPRSLAFRRLALRHGYRPAMVLGVKIDPFAAHCWVQSGSRVDNDSIERVRLFTPIHILW